MDKLPTNLKKETKSELVKSFVESLNVTPNKDLPKDVMVILSIMQEMLIDQTEPQVVFALLDFVQKRVSDILENARIFANHAKKKHIDVDDIKLADDFLSDLSFVKPPSRDVSFSVFNPTCTKGQDFLLTGVLKMHVKKLNYRKLDRIWEYCYSGKTHVVLRNEVKFSKITMLQIIAEIATKANSVPLPVPKTCFGLRIPSDRYCLTNSVNKMKSSDVLQLLDVNESNYELVSDCN